MERGWLRGEAKIEGGCGTGQAEAEAESVARRWRAARVAAARGWGRRRRLGRLGAATQARPAVRRQGECEAETRAWCGS